MSNASNSSCHMPMDAVPMKHLPLLALLALAPNLFAATLSQPHFQIELEDGWTHSGKAREPISIHHPNGGGVLEVRSFRAPGAVNPDALREMTNVDWSEALDWETWGDFSGYRYSYSEGGTFFRQWWLTDKSTVVLLVYSTTTEPNQSEKDAIDRIVRSLKAN